MKIEATVVAKGDRRSPDKMIGLCYIYFDSRCHDARRVWFEWWSVVGQKPLNLYIWDPLLRKECSLRRTNYFVILPTGHAARELKAKNLLGQFDRPFNW